MVPGADAGLRLPRILRVPGIETVVVIGQRDEYPGPGVLIARK